MPDEPSALTDQSRAAARDIAEWCADRHIAVTRTASQQLTYIWLLVASGIVALLFLPLIIEFIDFRLRAQTPPSEVVANAETAALALTADVEARHLQNARIVREIAATETQIADMTRQIERNREIVKNDRARLQSEIRSLEQRLSRAHEKRQQIQRERDAKVNQDGLVGAISKPAAEIEFTARMASNEIEMNALQARLDAVTAQQVTTPIDADPSVAGSLAAREGLNGALEAQKAGLKAAEDSLVEQLKVIETVRATNEALEQALKTAEPVRQAVSITTRVALLGLLIFLVQIVVNRYRYLQRLAGFYQARAQAFQLVASTPEGRVAEMLDGVKLGELTAALSPDAIGFDKSADPPTNQISSLLQAAIRR